MKVVLTDGGRSQVGYKGDARDCVVRSIAIALDLPYQQVYDELKQLNLDYSLTRRNRVAKTLKSKGSSPRNGNFRDVYQKYLESAHFFNFLKEMLPVDYALLIQRDPTSKGKDRYQLSHFHVRIDWPIADAAEDLARNLRYISKDLYEKGDKYAEDIQKKFFEYYGLPVMVGGRRTAAIVAAQYLKQIGSISTIYAGSSESRSVIRISETGVSKFVLMSFSESDLSQIIETTGIGMRSFKRHYVVKYKIFSHESVPLICYSMNGV